MPTLLLKNEKEGGCDAVVKERGAVSPRCGNAA